MPCLDSLKRFVKRKMTQSHRAHGDFRRYQLCDTAALCEVFLTCPANSESKVAKLPVKPVKDFLSRSPSSAFSCALAVACFERRGGFHDRA